LFLLAGKFQVIRESKVVGSTSIAFANKIKGLSGSGGALLFSGGLSENQY